LLNIGVDSRYLLFLLLVFAGNYRKITRCLGMTWLL